MRIRQRRQRSERYTMSLEQVWETAGQGYAEAVTEFHIVGGLHPELTLDWFCEMIRGLKERYPASSSEGIHDGGGRVFCASVRRSRFAKH